MQQTDVVIAGAGVIGMALALELRSRGRRVTLVERGIAGAGASHAAAGMLAAHDPANPPALQALSDLSLRLYPEFLARLATLAPGHRIDFETAWTLEQHTAGRSAPLPAGIAADAGGFHLLREHSLDPRRLSAALVAAVKKAGIRLLEGTALKAVQPAPGGSLNVLAGDSAIPCAQFVSCTGAWSGPPVRPVKGQMLRVHLGSRNPHLPGHGNVVLRGPGIYIVPRLDGSALIGATLEEKGFCIKTKDTSIADLRARAARLYPAVADAPELERWAGLRPATADCLPLLGATPAATPAATRAAIPAAPPSAPPGAPPGAKPAASPTAPPRRGTGATQFVATGHFRNGVLLAPATARVMANLLCGEPPEISLQAFAPGRFKSTAHR